ncbi:MAG TPA: hypothetical protein VMF60_01595 [Acidimicrobiales bacterium]|nr:hypothetical protein [Acidimicrobiales bacterium]
MDGPGITNSSEGTIHQAWADLRRIAAMIAALIDPECPSVDLLEAERSIHSAALSLGRWETSRLGDHPFSVPDWGRSR